MSKANHTQSQTTNSNPATHNHNKTPQVYRNAILQLQQGVGQEVRSYFSITEDGSFTTDMMVLVASCIK